MPGMVRRIFRCQKLLALPLEPPRCLRDKDAFGEDQFFTFQTFLQAFSWLIFKHFEACDTT